MRQRALSLVEIIVAITILSITMVGLLNVFFSANRRSNISRNQVIAAEAGKLYLESLQMLVRQDTWNAGTNYLGNYGSTACGAPLTINNHTYTPACTMTSVSTGIAETLVKVQLRIDF
jgi:prepilin-type N-terminal cleavage/methylation domain-containing protein